jgi:hypothetical protein
MAYAYTNTKGRTYYLHSKDVNLKGGRLQTIYYFSKEVKPGALHVLPSGKIVVENEKTGLPVLKNSEGGQKKMGSAEVLKGKGEQVTVNVNKLKRKRRQSGLTLLDYMALPGQLVVVAAANLARYAMNLNK